MSAAPVLHSKPAISTDIGATCALYRGVEFCLSGSITVRSAISSGVVSLVQKTISSAGHSSAR